MSSRSAARKVPRPAPKAASKSAKGTGKTKLAKVTRFPTGAAAKKASAPAQKKTAPPPPPPQQAKRHEPPPPLSQQQRGLPPLTAPRQVQPAKQSLARSFYWSELRVGDDLPPLPKPAIDRVQIVRYAASSGDFNRLHLDEPYAHQLGFPGLFAPGMLPMAFVGQLLTSWLRRGHVRKMSARFVKIVWPGDELTCRGRIQDLRKEGGGCYADVELWAENQKGELVLRGQATCELYESPQVGGGDGGGLLFALQNPPPPMASQRKSAPPPLPSKAPQKKK